MRNAKKIVLGILWMLGARTVGATPVASFTADQTNGCAPFTVQFTSTSVGAATYYWTFGNGNSSTLPNPSNTYTTPGQYTVSLTVTDAAGASHSVIQANYITVVDLPHASFYTNSQGACPDNNAFTFFNASTGASSYTWDFGDGTVSNDPQPTHSYSQSGQFTVMLIATNVFGCQDIVTRNQYITIYPKPDATVSANTSIACDTSTIFQFSNNSPNITSYFWNFGDGVTSTQANPSHQYTRNGTFQVSLVLQNSYGCSDTSSTTFPVRVGTGYWPGLSMDNDTGCAPMIVHFNNPNINIASCQWTFGDGTSSTLVTPDHTYANPGYYSVNVNIQTVDGCTVTSSSHVLVLAQPVVSFTHTNTTGCAPLTVAFTNTSQNFDSCRWLFGDGSSSYLVNPTHTYNNSGSFDVTLQCWNSGSCSKAIISQTLVNVTMTQAAFTADFRMGCPPLDVQFTALTTNPNLTYRWDFGDGSTSTQQDPSHTYTTTGTFNVSLIVSDPIGCTDTLTRNAYVQTINPTAAYTPPPTTIGCAPLTTQFTDATLGAVSWLWDFGDGTTSTLQNPVHSYTTPGLYTVSLTTTSAGGGCVQTIPNFSSFDVRGGYAGFSTTTTTCPPFIATFTDTSMNAVSWFWDFGDGSTSTDQHPQHTFAVGNYHSVSLSITTADGCTYSTMQNNGVYFSPFAANFWGMPLDTVYPIDVQFHANSIGATGWLWDFGDGGTSTDENPLHTFYSDSTNPVSLTIYNDLCTLTYVNTAVITGEPDTTPVEIGDPGIPEVQRGCAPLYVSFTQDYHIEDAMSFHWDFGDGETSSQEFPSHTYLHPGVYSVFLEITDSSNRIIEVHLDSIVRVSGPTAGFRVIQSTNCEQSIVTFVDTSRNASQWFWNFGDSTTSTIQSPVHTYQSFQSNYIITQTVSDTLGCTSTISTSIYSNSQEPVLVTETDVCGLDTLNFFTSIRNYAAYVWHFGDGDSSTLANPTHAYTTEGTFYPTLTTFDASGCTEVFQAPAITVSLPTAAFSTLNPRQGCDRLAISFINQSQNADLYTWDFGDGSLSTSLNPSHVYVGAGRYDVSLSVMRGNCISRKTEIQWIRVDTAYAAFTISAPNLCSPLQAQYLDGSYNAVSWSWTFANGDTSTSQNPLHVESAYIPRQVVLAIMDSNGCRDTARSYPLLIPDAVIRADSTTGCVPHTVFFHGWQNYGFQYFWDFGDGTTTHDSDPHHTYTSVGNYDVTLIVTSGSCADTMHIPAYIHVLEPVADFSTTDLYACAPSIVNFSNNSLYTDTYFWDFGDGSTSTNDTASHIYERPGLYSVSLIASSSFGCGDTLVRNQYIRVLGPETQFTASGFEGCSPYDVTFTDQSVNATQWMWSFGDGYTSTVQHPVHTYQDTGSFTVALVTTDTSGCSAFYEMPRPIVVHPTPIADFSAPDFRGCQPFTAQVANLSQYYESCQWNFGDGSSSTDPNPSHSYTQSGNYWITLIATNSFGCSDTMRSPTQMEILSSPMADFSVAMGTGCSPLQTAFYDRSYNTTDASYAWDFGNGTQSGLPSPLATYTEPGAYTVILTVTNSNGCSSSDTCSGCIQVADTLPPPETKILSVSVLSNTSVEIIWENSAARDLAAYLVYRYNQNTRFYDLIHTVNNPQNTGMSLTSSYQDDGLNTLSETYTYKVQAIDRCGYAIPLDSLKAHTTVNISSYAVGTNIQVNWTPYGGCPVATYQIFRGVLGEPLNYLATVPGNSYSYLDTAFGCPFTYSYRVLATDLCGNIYTSYSDTSVTKPLDIYSDQKVEVVRSTVVDNEYVLTEWKAPTILPEQVLQYDIFRSTDNSNFSFLTSVGPQQTDFSDHQVDVQQNRYYYKIQVINTCGIDEDLSTNTSTIVLHGDMDEGRRVYLQWSPYNGWESGVEYYVIEKKDGSGNWIRLKQLPGNTTQYDYQE